MLSEAPVVTVHIPHALRRYTAGHEEVMASGETVGEVLQAIGREYPAFGAHLLQRDGSLRPGLAVYLGPSSVRDLQGLATPVALEELVSIVPTGELPEVSVAGQGQARQAGPLDRIEHVLDDQAKLGVAGDLQLAVEEQRVGVLLASQQLQVGGQVGSKGQVGLAEGTEHRSEHAISIGV
jgi:molybdopterin converting factor small subunit